MERPQRLPNRFGSRFGITSWSNHVVMYHSAIFAKRLVREIGFNLSIMGGLDFGTGMAIH